jgi:hypothetical protein
MTGNGDTEGEPVRASMDGEDARLILGGEGTGGDVAIRDDAATGRVEVDGETGSLAFKNAEGETTVEYRGDQGAFVMGGNGEGAHLLLRDAEARVSGEIRAEDGEMVFYSADGTPAMTIQRDGTITTPKQIREGGRGRSGEGGRGGPDEGGGRRDTDDEA